jgi:hypothetical protein
MTSALTSIQSINTLYPQAGTDNSSQGFRDNFNYIQTALDDLDSFMGNLAGTTLNVNANIVTATTLAAALTTLQLGSSTFINVGQLGDTVIVGQNPDGTPAAGSIAFLADGSNPPFLNYLSLTSVGAGNIIAQSFAQNLVLSAGDYSDAYTNGTLVVEGGMGISKTLNVGGSVSINGNLNVNGNLINTSSSVTFDGITVTGNLIFKDSNDDASPSITLNTSSFQNLFEATDNWTYTTSTNTASNVVTGFQILPTGMIMMWGTTGILPWNSTATIPFPTLPGQSVPGFPTACLNLQLSYWNLNYGSGAAYQAPANNTPGTPGNYAYDIFPNIVSYSSSSFVLLVNNTQVQSASADPFTWFAIGY